MAMIPDPFLPEGPAIDEETGKMAPSVFWVKTVADPKAPTVEELKDCKFVGWMKP